MDDAARLLAAWAPRSPDELILELQLACVHPRVCIMAASAGIGVPDPEDAVSTLSHKKARLDAACFLYCVGSRRYRHGRGGGERGGGG